MKFIGQAIQVLKLFHYHCQLFRAGIKHTIQHALQTSDSGSQGSEAHAPWPHERYVTLFS